MAALHVSTPLGFEGQRKASGEGAADTKRPKSSHDLQENREATQISNERDSPS